MAINTAAATGIVVTTPAYNEASAGDQSQQTGSNTIVFANDIATVNNGDVVATPVFSYRKVIIRAGTGTEEHRFIESQVAGTGTTIIGTVSEDWAVVPAATDNIEVSYIAVDADTIGNDWKVVSKAVDDWDLAKRFTVSGTGFFALLGGHSISTVEVTDLAVAVITVETGGRFHVGYLLKGVPVNGGRVTGSAGSGTADGNLMFDVQTGGECEFYSCDVKGARSYVSKFLGVTRFKSSKLFNCIYDADWTGLLEMTDCVVEGKGLSTDRLTVDGSTDVQSMTFGNSNGFRDSGIAGVETIVLKGVNFAGLILHVEVRHVDKTFKLVDAENFDPVIVDQSDILFTAAGAVDQYSSFFGFVAQPNGTAISGAKVYVTEHLVSNSVVHELTTDVNGEASADVLYRTYRDNAGTSVTRVVYGSWAEKIICYGFIPTLAIIDMAFPQDRSVPLLSDPDITAATSATALTNGAGIEFTFHGTGATDVRPMKVIRVDAESFTTRPTYGDTISAAGSGASGTIIDMVIRESTITDYVLELWNGTEFVDNEALTSSGGVAWLGTTDTAGFYKEYSWFFGETANDNTVTVMYDYQIAQLDKAVITQEWANTLIGGDQQEVIGFIGNGSNVFHTVYNSTHLQGIWAGRISDVTGIEYLEADDGAQWTPPSLVTATFNISFNGVPPADFEWRLYENSATSGTLGTVELAGNETETILTLLYQYNYTIDTDVIFQVIATGYEESLTYFTLTNSNQIQNVTIDVEENI